MRDFINLAFWICYFNAVIHDISNSLLLWTVADFLMPPIAVIRGLILFFN